MPIHNRRGTDCSHSTRSSHRFRGELLQEALSIIKSKRSRSVGIREELVVAHGCCPGIREILCWRRVDFCGDGGGEDVVCCVAGAEVEGVVCGSAPFVLCG
jgi:hypothetical protein